MKHQDIKPKHETVQSADCFVSFLPAEVLLHIFTFMDVDTVRICSTMCCRLNKIGDDNALWKYLCTRDLATENSETTYEELKHESLELSELTGADCYFPFKQLYQWHYETNGNIDDVISHGDKWLRSSIIPSIVLTQSLSPAIAELRGSAQRTDCSVYRGRCYRCKPDSDVVVSYRGEFIINKDNNTAEYHGTGVMIQNKFTYRGEFRHGEVDGYGAFAWNSGDKYIGQLKKEKRHGKGVYKWADGSYYSGEYDTNKRHGQGVQYFKDGVLYRGTYVHGVCEGQGVKLFPDGNVYRGEFGKDLPNGRGILTFGSDRVEYEGEMKNGNMHGNGIIRWHKSNCYFEGAFQDGCRKGKGLLYMQLYPRNEELVVEQMWDEHKFVHNDTGYYIRTNSTLDCNLTSSRRVVNISVTHRQRTSDTVMEDVGTKEIYNDYDNAQQDSSVTDNEAEEEQELEQLPSPITSPPRSALNPSRSNSPYKHNTRIR